MKPQPSNYKRAAIKFTAPRDAARVTLDHVISLSVDVFNDDDMVAAVDKIIADGGKIDAFVYSAGFYTAGAIEEIPLADVQQQMYAYFFAPVRFTQFILPHMREQQFGRLMYMSSSAGTLAIPFHAAYSASKAALGRWSEALAYELRPFNIGVSYIEAGAIDTNAPNGMRPPVNPMDVYEQRRSAAEQYFKTSLGQGLPPSKIAEAIANSFESEQPTIRNRVGIQGKVFPLVQGILGEKLFHKILSRTFKIYADFSSSQRDYPARRYTHRTSVIT